MPSAVDRLCAWARQTFSSLFQFRRTGDAAKEPERAPDSLIYRLRRWPKLPSASMNTDIYRTLSVMSSRPVNRRWILNNSSLRAHEVDTMLRRLVEQGAVDVTDASKFQPRRTTA
jgi:hypothetical protein